MSYKVIHHFTDAQDNFFPYGVGDTYPRQGLKVSEKRIAELSTVNNKRNMKLIEVVEEVKQTNKKKK